MRREIRVAYLVAACAAVTVQTGWSETVAVKLAPGDWPAAERAVTPRQVLDYGAFVWAEVEASQLADLERAGVDFQAVTEPFTLVLGEERFDPSVSAVSAPEGWGKATGDGADLHLVQLQGPTMAHWLEEIEACGVVVVQYLHPHTYVVWGKQEELARVGALRQTRWVGPFTTAYRVQPRWRELPPTAVDVNVLLFRGGDPDAAVAAIHAIGGELLGRRVLNRVWENAAFSLKGDLIARAAAVPGVYSLQLRPTDGGLRGEMSNQVNVNHHDVTNLAYPGYQTWLAGVGLDGSGVVMANVDGGVQNDHPDLVGRLIACTGTTCGGSATDSHGTHTAGIMAADASSGVTSGGFLRGLGMAPGAELVEQVYSPYYTQAGGMLLLIGDSHSNGAVLSSNSWGPSSSAQGYDDDTMQVDIGVRDADDQAAGNQAFTYVLSFMNGNGGTSSQGTPDEAKNVFTVGSTKMQNSNLSQILAIDDVSSNSAHGPALDGRTIPHLVAPGCYVDSTVSGSGHTTMCGTSMASPHVSGAVALFFEHYRSLFATDPSPALVKAAFLPVAHDLAGHLDADGGTLGHPFDSKQGWGRLDLEAVVDPAADVLYFDDPLVLDATGELWQTGLGVIDPTAPLRVMLVWTDAPGHGLGGSTPAWNNDLDLEVVVGGTTYRGNVFGANGFSVSGGVADGKNNTEGVFLAAGAASSATIRVVASNVGSDGVPGVGDATDQDFAVVCYNCALTPDFTLEATPTEASVCAPAETDVTVLIGSIMGFADEVTLSAASSPTGLATSFLQNTVVPPGRRRLLVDSTGASAGSYVVTVTGQAATTTHAVDLAVEVSTTSPGVPTLVAPANGVVNQALAPTLTWTAAPGGGSYAVAVATDAGFAAIVDSATGLAATSYEPSGLATGTIYYWRVQASNGCGTDAWSSVFSFTTQAAPGDCSPGTAPVYHLQENFDGGDPLWATGGTGSTWALSSARSHSGASSYKAVNSSTVSDQRLTTPAVVLPASGELLTLQFWNFQDIEAAGTGACWDGGVVEVSTDGGSVWTPVVGEIVEHAYDGTVSSSYTNPLGGRQAWCAAARDWRREVVDLSSWAGQTVSFRYRLGTDSIIGKEGWYVDDVVVQGCPTTPPGVIFADGFEGGGVGAWSVAVP